jgi:hypothetical protein
MASTPNFGSTPRLGTVQLANADGTTAKDVANFTPVSAGTRVKEIRVSSGPTTAPGGTHRVVILVYDGTNARILESFTLTNTADIPQVVFRYDNLILPDVNHKIQVQSRTTLTSGATLDFLVFGQDMT